MPRRLTLSPLQCEILMMLEEAGGETVGTIIATLKPSDEVQFAAQVGRLVTLGLVCKEENNLALTEHGRIALRAWANAQWTQLLNWAHNRMVMSVSPGFDTRAALASVRNARRREGHQNVSTS